jgi:hypothetical protein
MLPSTSPLHGRKTNIFFLRYATLKVKFALVRHKFNMGDPLSVIASITAVLHLTRSVVRYLNEVKDASAACNQLLVEIGTINGLLSSLESLMSDPESDDSWSETTKLLSGENSPLALFKISIEQLATCLAPVAGLRRAGRAFVWPFKKDELTNILATVERQKTLFLLALLNDHL